MKIPRANLEGWAKELIDECTVSRDSRREAAKMWRSIYETGIVDPDTGCKHNKCFNHIDKLASFLFSPADVKFAVTFDADETPEWEGVADVASRHINRQFAISGCDLFMSMAVELGLIEMCSFVKLTWRNKGYEPHVIRQQFMGVLREDIEDLDRQDAFTHTFFLTKAQFRRLVANHSERSSIIHQAEAASQPASDEAIRSDYLQDIIVGGMQPLGVDQPTGARGTVNLRPNLTPMLAPEIAQQLIRVDDLWVWNDEQGDWSTLRYVDPGILVEGKYRLRNLSDIPQEHPFVKISPNDVVGYFWGRPELATVASLQDLLNRRVNDIDGIFRQQAKPSRAATGFSGLTDEKMRAMLSPGGTLTDDSPTGKFETFKVEMPENAIAYVEYIEKWFDEAGGFTPIMSGQGEQGVRAGAHASTLMRTSSPRLRDRALAVEKQCAALGEMCLKMSAAKNARVFKAAQGAKPKEFMLSQLPDDATVTVDSHTSSPAFSGDNTNLAFALARSQAIDGESLIEMTHPPREDALIQRYRKRQAEQKKLISEHPELLAQGAHRKHV